MERLKNFLVRLSDSLLASVPVRLRNRPEKTRRPTLRLVANNLSPRSLLESGVERARHPATGYAESIEEALRKSESWILQRQNREQGYWVHELEADTTLTSEYLMLRRFLKLVDPQRESRAVRYLCSAQLADGGWPIYHGGPSEISASVKAYFALKLTGVSADEPFMRRGRDLILSKGGVVSANVFTKIVLGLFGQYDWRGVPCMPPEFIFLPKWFYFNLYAISYWSRAVLIPLLIVLSHRPLCQTPKERGIEELFLTPPDQIRYREEHPFQRDQAWLSWRNFFVWVDAILRVYDRRPIKSLRRRALQKAESWIVSHMQGEGGLGAIYPAMVNSLFALHSLGYGNEHPLTQKALKEIEALEIYESQPGKDPTLHLQPCPSPVWDTALTLNALIERGLPVNHPALVSAASWLQSRQTQREGDWKISSPRAHPGGWYFQFENEWYPDVDDSAAVLIGLSRLSAAVPVDQVRAIDRGLKWVLAMQGSDGGWGAYDKDNNRVIFNKIPFADHQALLDPSTADLTGRCLEMLGTLGYDRTHPAVAPALSFLRKQQEPEGCWYGRWGVNYIYGTWCVLAGLSAIGEDMSAPWVRKATSWLEFKQNADGGWGESCLTYADRSLAGQGESTPSQTAWAILALLEAGMSDSLSVVRGIHFLLRHQQNDGSWQEPYHTGTGFPRVFYLRYHGYFQYFPFWALAMYCNVRNSGTTRADELRRLAHEKRRTLTRTP